jgi:hypothetical protein
MSSWFFVFAALLLPSAPSVPHAVPATQSKALDGHPVQLPQDLYPGATVLIVGFSRESATPSTNWGKSLAPVLSSTPSIGILQLPMLAEVPSLVRPLVLRSIRKQVPTSLQRNFIPLTANEAAWKQLAEYDPHSPDAAYVLLVDKSGAIRWQTHAPCSSALVAQVAAEGQKLLHTP